MWLLPVDVVCGGILPYLSICDLQALDTAYTNKCLRPQLRQVWKSYQYENLIVALCDDQIKWLCESGVRIISVTVSLVGSDAVFNNIPTLEKLHIQSKVFCAILSTLASNCPKFEELRVEYMYGGSTDDVVSALAQNCRQLHTLHIGSTELTDAGIMALTHHCRQLHTLYIGDAKVTDSGIQALCDNYPHLKHIGLSNCYNLTDASLIVIADSYPHLESISLYSYTFTNDGLIYFADKCHELRSVIVLCKHITSRGLTALWAANPNLMDVHVDYNEYASDHDIIQLVQYCPLLQKLQTLSCTNITDAAVVAVAEHCAKLNYLSITTYNRLSDVSLIALGQHCHELKSINISGLNNISDVGIAALAAGCPLLQQCSADWSIVTDAGVVELAHGCRDLRKFSLWRGKLISVAAVSAIVEKCPLVSELCLPECERVDDACLYVIAQHCRNLTKLNVSHTSISSADAMISVIKSCRMLREIVCYYCFKEEKDRAAIGESIHGVDVYF